MKLNPYEPTADASVTRIKYPVASRSVVRSAFLRGLWIGSLLGFVLGAATGIAIFAVMHGQDSRAGFQGVRGVGIAAVAVIVCASTVLGGLMGSLGFGLCSAVDRFTRLWQATSTRGDASPPRG